MSGKILVRKSDLARNLGISPTTVFNWTKAGLLIAAEKGIGGYLYEPETNRKRFVRIKELKNQGKKSKEIKEILDKELST